MLRGTPARSSGWGVDWGPSDIRHQKLRREVWYWTFKSRTKRFCNNFGMRDDSKAIKRVERFVHLFAYWYNRMRPHETFRGVTPSSLT
jgi:hypothetical protein